MAIAPAFTTVLIAVSYLFLYKGGFPDVKGGNASLIYFSEICKRTESKFINEYCEATQEALRSDVLGQVWRNSEILTEKYRCLKVAFIEGANNTAAVRSGLQINWVLQERDCSAIQEFLPL